MVRRTRWQRNLGAKAGAVIMSTAMAFSSLSAAMQGGVAFAETGEETDQAAVQQGSGDTGLEEPAAAESGATQAEAAVADGAQTENAGAYGAQTETAAADKAAETVNGSTSEAEKTAAEGTSTVSAEAGEATAENADQATAENADQTTAENADQATAENADQTTADKAQEQSAEGSGLEGTDLEKSKEAKEAEETKDATETAASKEAELAKSLAKSLAESEETQEAPSRDFDSSKTDVWDFGAANLGDSYNNRLDVYTINSFYEGVEAGSTGKNIASFSIDDGDFVFNDGGYSTAHRLRTINESLTRYDNKSLKDGDGNVYDGYIYSNKGSNADVYVALECKADDIITAIVSSNGKDSDIHFANMDNGEDDVYQTYAGGSPATRMVFYPSSNAKYKFYSATEKLVIGRIYREHASYGVVSGSVEGFGGTGSFDVVFTNARNGNQVRGTVADGKFSAELALGFDYELSLEGADAYVITSDKTVNISGDQELAVSVAGVELAKISGKIQGINDEDLSAFAENATFKFTPEDETSVYVPKLTLTKEGTFEVTLQSGVKYAVTVEGADDYTLTTTEVTFDNDTTDAVIEFVKKDLVPVEVETKGLALSEMPGAVFKFILLDEEKGFEDTGYSYEFFGEEVNAGKVALRRGQYRVVVDSVPGGFAFDEAHSKDVILDDDHITDGKHTVTVPFKNTTAAEKVSYKETVTVGAGKDYETIGAAIEAIRNMDRTDGQRVTVEIQPGNYQEMLVIDTPNVTLKNAVSGASIVPTANGTAIEADSVRITGYYGHGYTYYSMGADCKYDAELLEVNKYNGYASFENPGSGTTAGSYWNATVVVNAAGFEAFDIIFENSFNQYQSELAANDVIVAQNGAKEGSVSRAAMTAGDVTVQNKAYVERAAAMAIRAAAKEAYFNNCAFIGRQDTLYGDAGSSQAFYNCDIYGGTDYIFGGMSAVFAKCDLIFNTSEDKNDVGYITAAQQKDAGTRGYLMYNCHITSTEPGRNTASSYASKPGYLGRPWQANTSEVVFFNTVIDATCDQYKDSSASLINPEGWLSTLGGTTERNVEYGTVEMSGADNSSSRVTWAPVSSEAKTSDGQTIAVSTFLGDWDPFTAHGDDMTIKLPDGTEVEQPKAEETTATPTETTVFTFESSSLSAFAAGAKADGDVEKAGTEDFFTLIYSAKTKVDGSKKTFEDEYYSEQRVNFGGVASTEKNAIKFTTDNSAKVKIWWAEGGDDNRQIGLLDASGEQIAVTEGTWKKNSAYISTLDIPSAGTYYLGSVINNNYIFKVEVTVDKAAEPVVSVLEASDFETFAAGSKADGEAVKGGTDDYFTILYSAKSKIDTSSKTWEDGYTSGVRFNLGGKVSTEKNAVKFTTSSEATVEVWWAEGGDDNRQMAILDANGVAVATTDGTYTKNSTYYSEFKLSEAGTYYLGGATNNNYIFKVQVTDGAATEIVRKEWDEVDEPVITKVELNSNDPNKIDVTVSAIVGKDGGDALTAYMLTGNREILQTLKSSAEKNEFVFSFTPEVSGEYFFAASLSREDADFTLESAETEIFNFALPLTAPKFKNATNKGAGKVTVKFYSVSEAESYILYATDKTAEKPVAHKATYTPDEVVTNTTTEYAHTFVDLTVGHTYELSLTAKRGEDESEASVMDVEVTEDGEMEWTFAAFGQGVSDKSSDCGYKLNDDDSVTIWDLNNKGKLVPASTDGLSFYYAAVPANKNFTFTATAYIDSWTYTNGQEGFGIMAADRVGVNGKANVFWNNSYMASGTKVEYYYDSEKGEATKSETGTKVTMKLGLGAQEKVGVTKDNLSLLEANDTATVTGEFSSNMYPLETSCAANGSGVYNLFANEKAGTVQGTVSSPLSKVTLRIQKNNTGYFVSYLDENGNVITTKKFYDTDALEKLDSDYVYVGVFASRTFKATFTDIELTTIDPEDDAPAEERDKVLVAPNYKIISSTSSNTAKYELQFVGNADGVLTIKDAEGKTVVDAKSVVAGEVAKAKTNLTRGDNKFEITFTPAEGYHPEGKEYNVLSSYEAAEFTHVVKFETINEDEKVFVTPEGTAKGDGTKENPVDIYTAVKYTQPGQTIVLAAGTYNLTSTVKVERGIDGTPSKPIRMVAEDGRAVFDFGKRCAGFIFAGDYWYVKGIDCTKSANAQKGIQVSGSHITLEDVRAYENGNTGIQVSRYLSTDGREDWPGYDLILNCTSYSNADSGYEDADGFAAKLTVGDGVVFDGCIAYNNADDGWDLFAKVETGSIGQVTIQNCVAFSNGYGVDGTNEGNGNGFKMGGSSMAGNHKLINSAAWNNKAKGIDSNSGPNIQVYNCASFNNGSNNVALYTNDAANTDYLVNGVLSFRTENTGTNENIKARGTQDQTQIYGQNNFYWTDGKSSNNAGLEATKEWFVSLEAPVASASDPYAVAAAIRTEDGTINLGDFLKLSDTAIKALAGAELDYKVVTANLNGEYEIIKDERDINGSSDDAKNDLDDESGASTGDSSSDGNSSESGASTGGSSSDSSSSTDTGSNGNQQNDSGVSTSTSGNTSSVTAITSNTSSSLNIVAATGANTGNTVAENNSTGNAGVVNNGAAVAGARVTERDAATNNEASENVQEQSSSQEQNADTTSSNVEVKPAETTTETENTKVQDIENKVSDGQQTQTITEEKTPTSDKPVSKVPVVPVASGVVIIAAAAAIAIKTGFMAKLLAFLHIVK